ncbi:MAG TPA: CBS domain-containing protein [Planctomycetaceae bacterium]|jgi:CBS domain-containing protein|nr:CBS domain-containing protein [Planctomycetaceae bacterium]
MAAVREILLNKDSWVASIGPRASTLEAAIAMNRHKVGSLMVLDGERIVGILTERDLLQRVLAEQRDAAKTSVEDVMTTEILCCQPHTTIEEARAVMKNRRVRHLPVVDDRGLHGLISIGDLNAYEAHSQEATIHVMTEYIHGRA